MKDPSKTKQELIEEISGLKKKIKKLEKSEAKRNQAADMLRESEKYFKEITENSSDIIIIADKNGDIKYCSRSIERFTGYKPEELIGRSGFAFIHPDDVERAVGDFGKAILAIDSAIPNAFRIIRKDGSERYFDGLGKNLLDNPAVAGFVMNIRDVTEQKQTQEALRQGEEKYRTILEYIDNGYCEQDLDGNFTFLNDSMYRIYGYTQEELLGMNYKQYTDKESGGKCFQAYRNIFLTGEPGKVFDFEIIRKDGAKRHIESSVSLQKDSSGKPLAFRAIVRDVTERKRAEETIRQSEERYRTILDEMADAYFEVDIAGNYTFVNDAVCRHLGYSREELIGTSFRVIMAKEEYDKVYKAFGKIYITSTPERGIFYKLIRKDGTTGLSEMTAFPLKNQQGEVIGFRGVGRDITERERAEEALRVSEEKYRTILENIDDGYYEVNLNGNFTFFNDSACRILGYPQEEMMGMNNRQFTDKENAKKLFQTFNEVYRTGQPAKAFDWQITRKDGTERYIEVSVSLQKDSSGKRTGFRGISRDITERKALEGQLQQAQKMESVGRLAGGVAHDFNNMLGVIIGHTELALMKIDPVQPLYANLIEIRKAAGRSADLTRQLLAFARKQTVAPRVLDMNETVSGMLKMLKRLIGEDIDLNWQPQANLWPVKVDPSQIDQILANLCINARDAISGVGKITIEMGNSVIDKDYCATHAGFVSGEYVQIAVSDNGCGMDKETLAHIFEPFFTTKRVGEGTGLGLATVYGAVKQNNGLINVYSDPGQGSTFTIYLSRHLEKSEQLRTKGRAIPALRGHETILLVEDEPAILEITTMMLETQGYTVLAASSPGEAIRLARELAGEIHMLMTDVVMPEMNGRDLAKNLLSLYPHLKRLFMSGYTANVIAHHGVLDEGVYFIQKPFSIKELAAKVREALDSE